MARNVLGIVIGIIIGVIVIAIVESIGHIIFPPPEGVDLKDPDALKSIMKDIPIGAKLSVLTAWGLGVFAGGVAARKIAPGFPRGAWLVGVALFGGAAFTMVQIPHPLWMMIGAVLVTLAGIYAANAVSKSEA